MFGYATDETDECMPLTVVLAHKLNEKMAELRRNGTLPWLRPDSKTQVRWRGREIQVGIMNLPANKLLIFPAATPTVPLD